MNKIFICLVILLLTSAIAVADGSVNFEEYIVPILNTRPEFSRFILANFKIIGDPLGIRISNEAIPALGGARMGPYIVSAVWCGPNGEVPVKLTINTNIKFYNNKGREITGTDLRKAVKFTETLDSIEIDPPKKHANQH